MTARIAWRLFPLVVLLFVGAIAAGCATGAARAADGREADKEALTPLQNYVGAWRGAGQPRRGSTEGAWVEQAEWAWKFPDKGASLAFTAGTPKYLSSGELRPTGKAGQFRLTAKSVDGKQELTYSGTLEEGRLLLTADPIVADHPARITVRLVAGGDRLVVLYERKAGSGDNYARLAEVGYTRKDSQFGKGTSEVECVVTGGKGTIPVMHEGKTYYVCCTGCRDLFNDDPAGTLADYRARKAEEKEKGKK